MFKILKTNGQKQKYLKSIIMIYTNKVFKENRFYKKRGFVKLIKNCLFMNKFERFLENSISRIKLKTF